MNWQSWSLFLATELALSLSPGPAVLLVLSQALRCGTARGIGKDSPYMIAGKTGTAQVFGLKQEEKYDAEAIAEKLRDHALFIAFAPIDDPKIAVAVIVENGGGGGSVAAPIARTILDAYLEKPTP